METVPLLASFFSSNSSESDSSFSGSGSGHPDVPPEADAWEKNGGFLLYLAVMFYVFYGFEIICDEFLVPALNLFCEKLGMADDFAGATLMGLGCCAPDVFSGIFGVLVLHTDVGAGTIVGSLLFNHLAILGGICLAVPAFKIKLSSFIREVTFYAISLALLLWSLWDDQISVLESTLFLVVYIIFCIVCGYTPRISDFCNRIIAKARGTTVGAEETKPLLNGNIQESTEDALFETPEDAAASASANSATSSENAATTTTTTTTSSSSPSAEAVSASGDSASSSSPVPSDVDKSSILSDNEGGGSVRELTEVASSSGSSRKRLTEASQRAYYEISQEDLADLEPAEGPAPTGASIGLPYGAVSMHGFIQKKSAWYTKIKMSTRQWQTRWMVLDEQLWYCRNPLFPADQRRTLPLWAAYKVEVDAHNAAEFTLFTQFHAYTFRAENEQRAAEWVRKLRRRIEIQKEKCPDLVTDDGIVGLDEADDEDRSFWDMPEDKLWKKIMWVLALPYYALFTITIPNVKKKRFENWFVLSFIICLVWIGLLSYAMVQSADRFALVFRIPEDIMGLTITAIGASLPSFFGSVIAARDGSCHMAVSNTFGANLSSILVALGLPCFIQTAMVTPGEPFMMESNGIFLTVIVLVVGLVVFLISIAITKLWLNKPLGVLYFALYVILLTIVVVCDVYNITIE